MNPLTIALDVAVAVPRIKHDTSSGMTAGTTAGHDAKLSRAALSHTDTAQSE